MKKRISFFAAMLLVLCLLLTAVACGAAALRSIKVEGGKRAYLVGEAFSSEGLTVTAVDTSGSERVLGAGEYAVDSSAYDETRAGSYLIIVRAEGVSTSYRVTVAERSAEVVPSSLIVRAKNTVYAVGQPFDASSLEVLVALTDGTTRTASSSEYEVDASAYRAEEAGEYKIIVRLIGTEIEGSIMVKVQQETLKQLKILAIGNSFSDDATEYLYSIAHAFGVERVVIGNLYIGGCTLATHRTNAQNNIAAYEYRKNTTGSFVTTPATRLITALTDEDWDVITLQQASQDSGMVNTYNADLDFLANYVHENKTNPDAALMWHMTWAYQQNTTHAGFANYGRDQMTMYNSIVSAVQTKIVSDQRFSGVLPAGTAIQNARTSYFGDHLTRDGYHLDLNAGRYIAGLTWILQILGKDVSELTVDEMPAAIRADYDVIAESAANAVKTPFSVTQSQWPGSNVPIDMTKYELLDWQGELGYWNSSDPNNFAGFFTTASNSRQFVSSKVRFTREQLPNGTILEIAEGWRYRPEGWVGETVTANRPDNVTRFRVTVDDAWWGNFTKRAFNVSTVSAADLSGRIAEARNAFKIYVPKNA